MDLHTHPEWAAIVSSVRAHQSGQLDLALATAEDGFPVHPVGMIGGKKKPLTAHGFKDATTDVTQIIEWWNRHPAALVSIPCGETTGLAVLDIDAGGEAAFAQFMARVQLEFDDDLSRVRAITPSGGQHFYFECEAGTAPRTRAGDIAPNIDSRGDGGSIIIPGNMLPDGRSYRWASSGRLFDVPQMPRELLYLMTFNANDRRLIMETPALRDSMKWASPMQWLSELEYWRRTEQERISARLRNQTPDGEGMRRQATHDLALRAAEYSGIEDGRRTKLFTMACSVGKYVAHGVLTENEFRSAFMDAARANGALQKHGVQWASPALRNALSCSATDPLPPLAREFRTRGDA